MGSRRFFFFLPRGERPLDFRGTLRTLVKAGLTVDDTYFVHTVDADDLPLTTASKQMSDLSLDQSVQAAMEGGATVEVFANDMKIALTLSLGSSHEPPLLSVNMPNKTLGRLNSEDSLHYEALVQKLASRAGAEAVVVIDDPPDDFSGHLEAVDQQWVVDFERDKYHAHTTCEVWLQESAPTDTIVGLRPLRRTGRVIHGMREFRESGD